MKQGGEGRMGFQETFKALADPVRREILMMLKEGRMSAGEIAGRFDMTQATISYHWHSTCPSWGRLYNGYPSSLYRENRE